MNKAEITQAQLAAWSESYRACPQRKLAALALGKTDLNEVAFVPEGAWKMRQKFSVEIETLEGTSQQASGRCWLFAATNVLREHIAGELKLEKFELSQSFLAFWDKFERCNYLLQAVIDTAVLPADDRVVAHLLTTGVHDGGQWDMFVNIVEKYGLVPKDVYDETYQACHTRSMNAVLNRSLKSGAAKLRRMAAEGKTAEELSAAREEMLGKIYGFLCSCYGEPPRAFDFEYVDCDKVYHLEKGYTPLRFAQDYVGDALSRMVSIINAPTQDKPFHKTFTVKLLGNVVGSKGVKYLNLPMDEFKQAVIAQLQDGKVVWFGSDVGKFGEREKGIWDDGCFDFEACSLLETECGDILITHGHMEDVGFSMQKLYYKALESGCIGAFFGHTHRSVFVETGGVYLLNPGSLSQPRDGSGGTFALVTTSEAGLQAKIYYYEDFMLPAAGVGSTGGGADAPDNSAADNSAAGGTASAPETPASPVAPAVRKPKQKPKVKGGHLRSLINYSDRF